MSRRKKKSHPKQSAAARQSKGLHAFNRHDYAGAIVAWNRANRQIPNTVSAEAVAEAHFRLGVAKLYGQAKRSVLPRNVEAGLQALREAVRCLPGDPCYTYHLGVAEHHAGSLDRAVQAYQAVRKSAGASANAFAKRAAFPLALVLLQRGQDPAASSVWAELTPGEQTMLIQAQELRTRPSRLSSDVPPLWQGMAALDRGAPKEAEAALVRAAEGPDWPEHRATGHYYLGVLAARREEWDQAGRQWSAACAGGLAAAWVKYNMGELYHRRAEDWLQKEDLELALAAATEATRHKPDDARLAELTSQIYQRIGYQAASAGEWMAALEKWNEAREIGGGSFRLAYNLALAYEHAEDWYSAGETWREALRRRPRRADHPDAVTDDQVARLWRRAAEAYHKAGEYGESANVYRQALKWNPEDLETRMLLAQGLLDDGRLQAAENELSRVLERDPDHIPALLLIGEVIAESDHWWQHAAAPRYWKRVLELDPGHVEARQLLVDYLVNQAQENMSWGDYVDALPMYAEALAYQPQNARVLAALGGCHFQLGRPDEAQTYIDQAMRYAAEDLMVYGELIAIWARQGDIERAKQVMAEAEAAVQTIPFVFYVAQAGLCIHADWLDLARTWLDRAIEEAADGDHVYTAIGEMAVMVGAVEIGDEYLERAIEAGQDVGQVHLLRGVLSARGGDMDTAHRHWKEAEKVARKERDRTLQEGVEAARMVFGMPPSLRSIMLSDPSLLDQGGPLGRLPFPFLGFLDDEDEDDDDDGFF